MPCQLLLPQMLQSNGRGQAGVSAQPSNAMMVSQQICSQQQIQQLQTMQQATLDAVTSKASRQKKLQRYKEKKMKRKTLKQVRYPLRKANADQRPRIKGRFVRQNEYEQLSKQNIEIECIETERIPTDPSMVVP
eukprot:TRINITY_DN8173_c2_g1_i3.p2 TRINITY_DN8173_c2_g1~~TRINITY_DN8173_c2_g1_i3.p2  ORF type:complete len:134 (-),score=23.12 TRINITY_DN8173_c2_g1_i3:434-835(-)